MASLWQKKSGLWCIVYRENGKRQVRSLKTRDKREALKLARAVESTLYERGRVALHVSDRPKPQSRDPLLDEFWADFVRRVAPNRSPRTMEEYTNWFTQLRDHVKAEELGGITREDIEIFREALAEQGKRKRKGTGLQAVSINNALKTLNAIWNHAIKLGLFTGENPVADVERYKLPLSLDKEYLDKDQVDALLDAAIQHGEEKYVRGTEARNVYLAIALMALAGLRKREVCFARWDWVDWKGRIIRVTNDEHFTTKNKRPRVISMNVQLMEILQRYRMDDGYVLVSSRSSDDKTHYRVDFKKGFQKVCEISGVHTTPHQLRHSFATRHAVAGTSLHVIAGWLGHSTTWVTQRYAHFQKTFNEAADNI